MLDLSTYIISMAYIVSIPISTVGTFFLFRFPDCYYFFDIVLFVLLNDRLNMANITI